MTAIQQNNPIHAIIQSQLQEILNYKWIESEKAGHDIGWENADAEWTRKHFSSWKQFMWKSAIQETDHSTI